MIYCGIDPGVKGALVALGPDGSQVLPMPTRRDGKEVDGVAVAAWLLAHDVERVVIEKVGARNMFNASGKAIRKAGNEFRFATGYGVLQGVIQSLALPHRRVPPMTWKGRVLRGLGTDKQAAITYVQQALPQVDLMPGRCRTPQDGVADAACLAVYGRDHVRWN